MTAESAARELAKQVWAIALSNAYGKPERDVIGEITTLITAALKRCRNEALEEAAKLQEKECDCGLDGCLPVGRAKSIRNLKEEI